MKQKLVEQHLDHPLLADIYEKTAPQLLAYARSRLSSPQEAEDLLVEAFLSALEWEKFPLLTKDEQFAWLRRVAQYKIIDKYRRMGRLPTIALQHVEKTLTRTGNENPEQAVIRQEELQNLQKAIDLLPPLQQQVVFLHFAEGLRCIEIASILGKRDGTVRVLLSRALNHLRNVYHN